MVYWKRYVKDGVEYIVSNNGDVFSMLSKKLYSTKVQNGNGYMSFKHRGKKPVNIYRHRLVAELFIPNPNNYKEVNHKDGNKSNNYVDNLEWCDRAYNTRHSYQTGLRKVNIAKAIKLSTEANKKPIKDYLGNEFASLTEASRFYGLTPAAICSMLKGRNLNRLGIQYINKQLKPIK